MSKWKYWGLWTFTYLGTYFGISAYIRSFENYSVALLAIVRIIIIAWYLFGCNWNEKDN